MLERFGGEAQGGKDSKQDAYLMHGRIDGVKAGNDFENDDADVKDRNPGPSAVEREQGPSARCNPAAQVEEEQAHDARGGNGPRVGDPGDAEQHEPHKRLEGSPTAPKGQSAEWAMTEKPLGKEVTLSP